MPVDSVSTPPQSRISQFSYCPSLEFLFPYCPRLDLLSFHTIPVQNLSVPMPPQPKISQFLYQPSLEVQNVSVSIIPQSRTSQFPHHPSLEPFSFYTSSIQNLSAPILLLSSDCCLGSNVRKALDVYLISYVQKWLQETRVGTEYRDLMCFLRQLSYCGYSSMF